MVFLALDTNQGLLADVQKKCKEEKVLQKYCPDH